MMRTLSASAVGWEGAEFLELAEASAGIGVWDMDLATGMVRGRPQFFRLMGLDPATEQVSIEVIRALRHPDDRANVIGGFQQSLKNQIDYYESEYRIIKDGQVRWILGRGCIVRDARGEPVRYSGVDIDITDRKRFEETLRAAEARFHRVFQLAPIAMSISTLQEGRYIDVNAALTLQAGYSREEMIGRTARELGVYVNEDDFGNLRRLLAETGIVKNLELMLRGKRDTRTMLLSAEVLDLGQEQCLLTASVDISDRKAVESALLQSEQRYRNLVDNANDIVATLDLDGRFTSINPAVRRVLGYAPEELIGLSIGAIAVAGELPFDGSRLQRELESEGATRHEMQILNNDGHPLALEVNWKLIRDNSGRPIAMHSICRDVTERKDAEARQSLLIRELQHRAKNLLAVVQSIVSNTLRNSKDVHAVNDTVSGRLQALARAQEFIAAGPGGGAPIGDIVQAELVAFGGRVRIEGPALVAGTAFAQMFAIVVHELATNATKYGSLSVPEGHVDVRWLIEEESTFCFSWKERGGPPIDPPARLGFGSEVMRVALIENPRIFYGRNGFEYEIKVPIGNVR
ncbi:MAG TPA: PAS domain S-box protein [Hyphomicrobiaceae bacterium]|nr:PAS domain S-box protein [Hyphomicrobiaceae bacterium]